MAKEPGLEPTVIRTSKEYLRPEWTDKMSRADYIQALARYTRSAVPRHVFAPSEELQLLLIRLADAQEENRALRNLAENLRPGPISEALAGAAPETKARRCGWFGEGRGQCLLDEGHETHLQTRHHVCEQDGRLLDVALTGLAAVREAQRLSEQPLVGPEVSFDTLQEDAAARRDAEANALKANAVAAPLADRLAILGYAPGNYSIRCMDCKEIRDNCDKRALRCHRCALAKDAANANDPLAQLEDDAAFGEIVEEIQAERGEKSEGEQS